MNIKISDYELKLIKAALEYSYAYYDGDLSTTDMGELAELLPDGAGKSYDFYTELGGE